MVQPYTEEWSVWAIRTDEPDGARSYGFRLEVVVLGYASIAERNKGLSVTDHLPPSKKWPEEDSDEDRHRIHQ